MEDKAIVELYFQRDERALSETENKYNKYLSKIAFNILSDEEDTKESVNDTYLAAWNSIPPQRPAALSAYLAKLTRRISIGIFRKRNAQRRRGGEYALSLDELSECLGGGEELEAELEAKALGEAINRFLHGISKEARTLFVMRYYFLDPLKDCAQSCGISESKAKSLLFRTRCALREFLEKEGFDI